MFESYPPKFRRMLLALRRLILKTAKVTREHRLRHYLERFVARSKQSSWLLVPHRSQELGWLEEALRATHHPKREVVNDYGWLVWMQYAHEDRTVPTSSWTSNP